MQKDIFATKFACKRKYQISYIYYFIFQRMGCYKITAELNCANLNFFQCQVGRPSQNRKTSELDGLYKFRICKVQGCHIWTFKQIHFHPVISEFECWALQVFPLYSFPECSFTPNIFLKLQLLKLKWQGQTNKSDCLYLHVPVSLFHTQMAAQTSTKFCTDHPTNSNQSS